MQQSISVKLSNVNLKNKSELQLELLKKETNNILNESISTFNTRTADLYSDLSQSINKKINEQISNRQKEIDKKK